MDQDTGANALFGLTLIVVCAILFASGIGQSCGTGEGRCQATCESLNLPYDHTDGDACWCDGSAQPVAALGRNKK